MGGSSGFRLRGLAVRQVLKKMADLNETLCFQKAHKKWQVATRGHSEEHMSALARFRPLVTPARLGSQQSRRIAFRAQKSAPESKASFPSGVAMAYHGCQLTPVLTNRTEPSMNSTFTPPGWFELAFSNVYVARESGRAS